MPERIVVRCHNCRRPIPATLIWATDNRCPWCGASLGTEAASGTEQGTTQASSETSAVDSRTSPAAVHQ
jgi:hypothetical protein